MWSNTGEKKIARGYCRVSTVMQSELGISLETQRKRISDYCDYKHVNLIEVYEDAGISGKDMSRPGLQKLLHDIQKGEYVIITDLSRLSRNTRDALGMFETLKTKGVFLVCLHPEIDFSSAIGELMFTTLMAVHNLERQNISSQVSNNMKALAKEGKLRSRPPFGYKFVSKECDLEPVESQQRVIEKIKEMFFSGIKLTHIANKLNTDGDNVVLLDNKRTMIDGKIPLFYAQTVKRILEDVGLVRTKDVRVPISTRVLSHRRKDENNVFD